MVRSTAAVRFRSRRMHRARCSPPHSFVWCSTCPMPRRVRSDFLRRDRARKHGYQGARPMDRITVAKIALALAGVGIFAYGIRSEDNLIRWVGIGLVVVAFLLRFFKTTKPDKARTG